MSENLSFEVVEVTPELATEWLNNKAPNRNIRKTKLEQFAASMRAGAWKMTGEAIKFNIYGELVDGQHRLSAVQLANVSVPMTVVRGVTAEAANVLDTGNARTAGDVLKINDVTGASAVVAAAAKLLVSYYEGSLTPGAKSSRAVTSDRVLEFCQTHPDFVQMVEELQNTVKGKLYIPGSYYHAAAYLMARADRDAMNEFTHKMANGIGMEEGSPLLTLRERMLSAKASREYHSAYTWISAILRAFNTWRRGETLARIIMYGANNTPIPIPELVPANQDGNGK